MVNPLVIMGLLAVKKAIAVSIFMAGQRYGWPRVYRRVLEYNRRLMPSAQQPLVRSAVRDAFRIPGHAAKLLEHSEVYTLAQRYIEEQRKKGIGMGAVALMQRRLAEGKDVLNDLADLATKHLPKGARKPGDLK